MFSILSPPFIAFSLKRNATGRDNPGYRRGTMLSVAPTASSKRRHMISLLCLLHRRHFMPIRTLTLPYNGFIDLQHRRRTKQPSLLILSRRLLVRQPSPTLYAQEFGRGRGIWMHWNCFITDRTRWMVEMGRYLSIRIQPWRSGYSSCPTRNIS